MTTAAAEKTKEQAKGVELPPTPTTDPMVAAVEKAHRERVEHNRIAAEKSREDAKPTLHALQALMGGAAGETQLGDLGAALFVAHMLVELGTKKVHEMKGPEVLAYATRWRSDHPMAWPTVRMGYTVKFVKFLEMYGIEHDTVEGYQSAMARIAPAERQVGF